MHSMKKGLSDITLIVVPKCLRERILIVSHEDMAGHLGSKKTLNIIITFFFWRSIAKEVNYFCKTCQICQLLGKGPYSLKAPLISLPIETESFKTL